jgi:hypothetical protein
MTARGGICSVLILLGLWFWGMAGFPTLFGLTGLPAFLWLVAVVLAGRLGVWLIQDLWGSKRQSKSDVTIEDYEE